MTTPSETADSLKPIQSALMAIAANNPPNWRRPLASYRNGWVDAISAVVVSSDSHGPSVVYWMGHHYIRRAGSNPKYGVAIWFSRPMGKNEADEPQYARLITFSDKATPTAEPLPEYVADALARIAR
jgi:hypothetical protein